MTADKLWSFAIALVAVAGAIANLAIFAHDYPLMPATVPTHFGISGAPDAFGPRTTFLLFPVLGGVFAALAVVFWAFVTPSSGGRPVPAILPTIVVLILAETTWMMFLVELGSFSVALGRAGGLGSGVIAGLAVVLVTTIVLLFVSLLAVRPPN